LYRQEPVFPEDGRAQKFIRWPTSACCVCSISGAMPGSSMIAAITEILREKP
jgi:hypothetical protein